MVDLHKVQGSFLGLAIGDALGMATESYTVEQICDKFGYLDSYQAGYLPAGSYTDDTQQAIILAESLILNNGLNLKHYGNEIANRTQFERGIGPTLLSYIKFVKLGIVEDVSDYPSNGLPMKIGPVGIFYHNKPEQINNVVIKIASLTHKNKGSVAGAIAIAHAVQYNLTHPNIDLVDFKNQIMRNVALVDKKMSDLIESEELEFDMGCNSYTTVPNAIITFINTPNDFRSGMELLINSGGDTDTKAAMYGAISGAYNGLHQIPAPWIEGLENGKEGRDHILDITNKIHSMF